MQNDEINSLYELIKDRASLIRQKDVKKMTISGLYDLIYDVYSEVGERIIDVQQRHGFSVEAGEAIAALDNGLGLDPAVYRRAVVHSIAFRVLGAPQPRSEKFFVRSGRSEGDRDSKREHRRVRIRDTAAHELIAVATLADPETRRPESKRAESSSEPKVTPGQITSGDLHALYSFRAAEEYLRRSHCDPELKVTQRDAFEVLKIQLDKEIDRRHANLPESYHLPRTFDAFKRSLSRAKKKIASPA
ncbi:hypothetical protein FYK55_00945 [Roseiconus nitratireducens]|uniref:Uncharacterized protein n=1 Tax=Roseiconus nitratireducens TaxID=2605748 RepID=A0A5M6DHJ4_9BACT|nr:hypothetical protein [Roseiconus nitratireducens]KAA5547017.1 hypothetical protein FYK55_00945 [Roseiconus nitratireducens]